MDKIFGILKELNNHNYEAYIVGGFVRDYLMNRISYDIDITTNAKSYDIIKIFSKYQPFIVNKKYETVTMIIDEYKLEITPFRIDGISTDHRHPGNIIYTSSIMEDIKRRDFTINAILMDANQKIIDPINGIADINNHLIKAIGDPHVRFEEDALRILRALRFEAKLHFMIEDRTLDAIYEKSYLLKNISMQRKQTEILSIIKYNKNIIDKYHDIFNDILKMDISMNLNTDNMILIYALLLHQDIKEVDKLIINKKVIAIIKSLIKYADTDDYIEAFSSIEDTNLYIKYIYHLKNIDIIDIYNENKDYIVNKKNLEIKPRELMELGIKDIEINKIQNKLINDIRHKLLKNVKEDIKRYLIRYMV